MAERCDELITPKNETSKVWEHFEFPKGKAEGKKAFCKICKAAVVHMGGTTTLNSHLYTWHRLIHDELYKDSSKESSSSSPSTMDNFVSKHVSPLPPSLDKAKRLTRIVCEMITRDIWPVNIVNNIGFLNLLKKVEPRYVVPCRTTVTRSDLYMSEKWCIRGIVVSAEFLSCTTDMWSSRNGDGYIAYTCHFINPDFKMCCHNLQTHHFPGTHNCSSSENTAAKDWCISFDK